MTQKYVCGFMFNLPRHEVLLIRKARPAWQAGFLNGIGGKIEDWETPDEAMDREFREETNVAPSMRWQKYCVLSGEGFEVHFYRAFVPSWPNMVGGSVNEALTTRRIRENEGDDLIANVRWLIEMALSMDRDKCRVFYVKETY